MPIPVTCPGCLTRFTVSDKYAGKTGPCPKCKKELVVPDKSQEVVVHAPEVSGPKDSKGVAVLKPLKRAEFKLSKNEMIVASILFVLSIGFAIFGRVGFAEPPLWLLVLGVLALSFPLAWIGYTFFHDDELAEYSGRERLARVGSCAAVFAISWGLYWFLASYLGNKKLADIDSIQFAIFVLIMFAVGTIGSVLTMELEFGQSLMHYSMYFGVTFLLVLLMGLQIAEPLSMEDSNSPYPGLKTKVKPSPNQQQPPANNPQIRKP
ncbi:MAG: hypothetical protein WCK15_18200 [Pirellula sp.]